MTAIADGIERRDNQIKTVTLSHHMPFLAPQFENRLAAPMWKSKIHCRPSSDDASRIYRAMTLVVVALLCRISTVSATPGT